jgi:hypothetical protein
LYACTSKASKMSTCHMARMRRSARSPSACQYLYFCTSKASAARAPLGAADLLTLRASSTHFTGFTGTKGPGTLQGYGGGHFPASCRPPHSPRTAAPCTCRSFFWFRATRQYLYFCRSKASVSVLFDLHEQRKQGGRRWVEPRQRGVSICTVVCGAAGFSICAFVRSD